MKRAEGDDVVSSGGEAPATTPAAATSWFDQAEEVARRGIRADKARVSSRSQELLSMIEARLFEKGFEVSDLESRFSLHTDVRQRFAAEVGMGLQSYLVYWRMTAAAWLLSETELPVWKIGRFAGYTRARNFSRRFRRWSGGETPTGYRLLRASGGSTSAIGSEMSEEDWSAALVGEIEPEAGLALIRELEEATGVPHGYSRSARGESRLGLLSKDAGAVGPEVLYRALRRRSFPEQLESICGDIRFSSLAFFRLLGQKVIPESREDGLRGIQVAKLAQSWLKAMPTHLETARASLEALAWAWLGNAHRLADDFDTSERCFRQVNRLRAEVEELDSQCAAEIHALEGSLRLSQQRFREAREHMDSAIALCRALNLDELLVRCLLQRTTIIGAGGDPLATLPDHYEALSRLRRLDSWELTLQARHGLATNLALAERYQEAEEHLAVAQSLCEQHGHPLLRHQLEMVQGMVLHGRGDLRRAARAFADARSGMIRLGRSGYVALVSLEFSLLRFRQSRFAESAALASEALPLFSALAVAREARVALGLLRDAILADRLTEEILIEARDQLRRLSADPADPLSRIGGERGSA